MPRPTKPRSASVMAISRPMPWLAPVTTATFCPASMADPSVLQCEMASHNALLEKPSSGQAASQRQPAVDDDRLPVDVARVVRAEEGDHRGDLVRSGNARSGDRRDP